MSHDLVSSYQSVPGRGNGPRRFKRNEVLGFFLNQKMFDMHPCGSRQRLIAICYLSDLEDVLSYIHICRNSTRGI